MLVFFDVETTGVDFSKDNIIEIALLVIENNKVIVEYDEFIKQDNVSSEITELTGITNALLMSKGKVEEDVAEYIFNLLSKDSLMIAYNLHFDMNFLYNLLCKYYPVDDVDLLFESLYWLDLLTVFKDRKRYPHKLSDLVEYYHLGNFRFHRAIDDTKVLPLALTSMVKERNDVRKYINIFGYNPKYDLSGKRFDFIRYAPQKYNNKGVRSSEILPYKIKYKGVW